MVRREGWLASDDPAVLDHALHADNTRVDRGNPAIAVLSIGYQSLGSCSRAAGWSAATLCIGTFGTCRLTPEMSAFWGISEVPFQGRQTVGRVGAEGVTRHLVDS